jgi:hypothetical protein
VERRIEGLPTTWVTAAGNDMDLSIVPTGPVHDTDPNRAARMEEYAQWYRELRRYRAERWLLIDDNPALQEIEKEKCRRDPLYFIAVYCFVYEVREDQGAGSSFVPAIPFAFQYDLIRWMQQRMRARGAGANGAISKSRDMGATWFCVLFVLHQFLFAEPFSAKLISRREDLVDDPGNMDSMMERIAANMEHIPSFLLPAGWTANIHRSKLKIRRPDNKNTINGESTSRRSGRGGRATMILIDEMAFIDNLRPLLSSVMQTAPHIIGVSSESVEHGEDWLEYRDGLTDREPDAVLGLDWWMHPYHDREWFEQQRERYGNDEAGFAREVMREAWAGLSTLLYPKAWDMRPLAERWEWDGITKGHVNIDPGYDDECALHIVMEEYEPGRDLVFDALEARQLPPEFYAAIICGVDDEKIIQFGADRAIQNEALRLARLFRDLPEMIVYGDPAGAQKHHGGDSWYDRMILYSLEHNRRKGPNGKPKPLVIEVQWKKKLTQDATKRAAMMLWLDRLDFNQNRQAIASLTALQKSRFDEPGARGRQAEQKNARHDQWSHRRTALEYSAVNLEARRVALQTGRATPYLGSQGTRVMPRAVRQ